MSEQHEDAFLRNSTAWQLATIPDKFSHGLIKNTEYVVNSAIMAMGALLVFLVLWFFLPEHHEDHMSSLHSWMGQRS